MGKRRWLRWVGIGVGALVGVFALFIGGAYATSVSREGAHYEVTGVAFVPATSPDDLAEGQRLYRARGCADCHADDAGGKVVVDDPGVGRFVAPNLTVIGAAWSPENWERAVRSGVSPQGRGYLLMPAHEMRPMPLAELGKIVGFVRSLPRIERSLPPNEVRFVGRIVHALGAFPAIPAEQIDHGRHDPEPRPGTPEYGRYLVNGCTGCHGAQLSGGVIPGADPALLGVPPNLTPHPTGLSAWTDADITRVLRTGVRKDGSPVNPQWMPWRVTQYMTDAEIADLIRALRALPPVPEGNR